MKCLLVAQRATRDWGGRWKLMASMASKGRMVIGFTVGCNTSMMTQANMAVGI